MNIPQYTIEPFGYTGMPTLKMNIQQWEQLVEALNDIVKDVEALGVRVDIGVIKEWLESELDKYDDLVYSHSVRIDESCNGSSVTTSATIYLITTLSVYINRIHLKFNMP